MVQLIALVQLIGLCEAIRRSNDNKNNKDALCEAIRWSSVNKKILTRKDALCEAIRWSSVNKKSYFARPSGKALTLTLTRIKRA